jgi:hypothetical protein
MEETARYLVRRVCSGRGIQNWTHKTIILTGAMVPYKFWLRPMDCLILGSALAYAQMLPSGASVSR